MNVRRLAIAIAFAALAVRAHGYFPEWVPKNSVKVSGLQRIETADFNGDNRPDIVGYDSAFHVGIILTQSDGSLGAWTPIYQGNYLSGIAVADVNGDGRTDVVVCDVATNTLIVLLSNGDGTFAAPISTPLASAPTAFTAADFDGDGVIDVVFWSYSSSTLTVMKGDGSGHFTESFKRAADGNPTTLTAGDLDGDGRADLVVLRSSPIAYEIYFGKADGTLDDPIVVAGPTEASSRIRAVDLDGDGRLDLVSSEFYANTVTVVLNGGGRSFAPPNAYPVFATPAQYGSPWDFIVADVTGDGHSDVVVSLANSRAIGTFPGLGDGTLGQISYTSVPQGSYYSATFPEVITAGDFTGDGRPDIALVTSGGINGVTLFANACGDTTAALRTTYPVISAGQTATLTAQVGPVSGYVYPYGHGPTPPTGTVVFSDGPTILGTGTLVNGTATLDVASLPVGEYGITAAYDGDASYRSAVSAVVPQKVVTEQTVITLTSDQGGVAVPYGQQFGLHGTVSSDIPGAVDGTFWLYTDDQRSQWSVSPTDNWINWLAPGTHTFYLRYEGNATHPPATSNAVTQVVKKAQSVVAIDLVPYPVRYSANPQLRVSLSGIPWGGVPGGNVHLFEGRTLLATTFADNRCCSGGMSVFMSIPVLDAGVHYIYATYDGDKNFEPGRSPTQRLLVLGTSTFPIEVTTSSSQFYVGGLFSVPLYGYYTIERRIGSGPWQVASSYALYPNYSEFNPKPGTVYAYRMHAYDGNNHLLADSDTEMAMLVTFTDDPLDISTVVKAQHIQELIMATNTLRASVGLAQISVPEAVPGGTVRASHLVSIYSAVNEARALFGALPIPLPADLAAGQPIRMRHLQNLREALH